LNKLERSRSKSTFTAILNVRRRFIVVLLRTFNWNENLFPLSAKREHLEDMEFNGLNQPLFVLVMVICLGTNYATG
jgi:hypothetical protein